MERRRLLAVGAVACAACCAGPLLTLLGGLTLFGLASTVVLGWLGLAIGAASGLAWLVVRRRRAPVPSDSPTPSVSVADPTRRPEP